MSVWVISVCVLCHSFLECREAVLVVEFLSVYLPHLQEILVMGDHQRVHRSKVGRSSKYT